MEKKFQKELIAFGKRLKNLRIEKGMTQLDLEVASGVTEADISRIENGKQNIEFYTLVKLASALDLPLKELFEFD